MVLNLLESSFTPSLNHHLRFFQIIHSFFKKRLDTNLTLFQVVSLDLSRLATTLNRLERSIQIGINKWYQREYEFHDDNPPPPVTPTQQALHTLSTIKLLILKKESSDVSSAVYYEVAPQVVFRCVVIFGGVTLKVDEFDLEEMYLKWQVAMICMRLKKFYKKTVRSLQFNAKEPVGFDNTKVECFNCHNTWHFARECRSKGNQESRRRDAGNTRYKAKDNRRRPEKQEEPKALVTLDGDGVDWTGHAEDEQENFAKVSTSQ
ncbi:ribonuclease H-like domain-containing protein [Tanacetum coccineum]|uniref:Ribonuclease H-like domain-containing protein n=1 Tax=Tanacetum coccineum TaxID=301880 RepID=A0ABQ5AEC3_9ASTR